MQTPWYVDTMICADTLIWANTLTCADTLQYVRIPWYERYPEMCGYPDMSGYPEICVIPPNNKIWINEFLLVYQPFLNQGWIKFFYTYWDVNAGVQLRRLMNAGVQLRRLMILEQHRRWIKPMLRVRLQLSFNKKRDQAYERR